MQCTRFHFVHLFLRSFICLLFSPTHPRCSVTLYFYVRTGNLLVFFKSCCIIILCKYPEFYSFPPFFTIQPVEATKEKQLSLWNELIIQYYTIQKLNKILIVHECPLWYNKKIQRRLSKESIDIIMENLIKSGRGEWIDTETKTTCRILWRKPEELATDIYEWAISSGNISGGICTIYELHSGEDVHGMSFQGIDEDLLRRALTILEDDGKCTIFKGETSSEDGIKFY